MNQGICSMFMQQILTSHDLLWIPYNYGDHSFESTEPWLIQHRGPTLLNGHAKFGVSTIHYTRVRLNLLQKSEVSEQDSNLFQAGWERGREVERERKREREKERNLLFGREKEMGRERETDCYRHLLETGRIKKRRLLPIIRKFLKWFFPFFSKLLIHFIKKLSPDKRVL